MSYRYIIIVCYIRVHIIIWWFQIRCSEKKPARRSMDCQAVYMDQCRKLGIVPASCILKHIDDEKLKLRHRGIGPRGAEALALTLVVS